MIMNKDLFSHDGKVKSSRYAYATGRIRALEVKLISANRLNRYLEAQDSEEVGRLLIENGYPADLLPERSLDLGLKVSYELIRSLSPLPNLSDIFYLEHDFHNLKVILKAFSVYWPRRESNFSASMSSLEAEQDPDEGSRENYRRESANDQETIYDLWPAIHSPVSFGSLENLMQYPGTMNPQVLFNAVMQQKPAEMPVFMAQAASEAARRYQQAYDIGEIDIVLDKALAKVMINAARMMDIPFLIHFLQLRIDLINLGLLLRTRFLNSGRAYLEWILLPGGTILEAEWSECFNQSIEAIAELAGKHDLHPMIEAIREYEAGGEAISRFSLASDDMLMAYVRKARMVLRGPEVLLGYLIAREMEIRTIRIILTCIRNRIPIDKARALARLTYL
jgi:V/A-type H+/Na+-transporting ATPase subunit C